MDNTIMVLIRHVKVAFLTNALAPPHSQNAGAAIDYLTESNRYNLIVRRLRHCDIHGAVHYSVATVSGTGV